MLAPWNQMIVPPRPLNFGNVRCRHLAFAAILRVTIGASEISGGFSNQSDRARRRQGPGLAPQIGHERSGETSCAPGSRIGGRVGHSNGHHAPLPTAHGRYSLMSGLWRSAIKMGGEHELATAGFPSGRNTGRSGCDYNWIARNTQLSRADVVRLRIVTGR
jgi:hypothetical protein